MENKKLQICSLAMTAGVVVLGLLENLFVKAAILASLSGVLSPILFIASVVCAYFAFKEQTTYPGKCTWIVIALQTGLALRSMVFLFQLLFIAKAPALNIVASLLTAAGHACIVAALLDEKIKKFLPFAFPVLILGVLGSTTNVFTILISILLFAALAVMAKNALPRHNHLLRLAVIILAVVGCVSIGVFAAASWILLAFIFAPGQKPAGRFSLAKFAAVVCMITAVVSLAAFLASKPMAAIDAKNNSIKQAQETIVENEERIVELEAEITEHNAELESLKVSLQSAEYNLKQAEDKQRAAENNLAPVCSRSSYSYWYCTDACRALHEAVSDCKAQVSFINKEVTGYKNSIYGLEGQIQEAEDAIKDTEEENVELAEKISRLRSELVSDWFVLLVNTAAALVAVASLGALSVCLFKSRRDKLALLSCGGLALSALLYIAQSTIGTPIMATPFTAYVLNPHAWTILISALFATIFIKKEGKLAKFRVFAILAAIAQMAFVVVSGFNAVFVLFFLTVIFVALALVPPVFTEYNSIAKHLFFSLISFGIWQLIWTYHVTKNLNKVSGVEHRKPGIQLLLCLFLPFYYTYWIFKTAEYVEAYGQENNKPFKLDILCLVFAFICPLFSTVLIQNKINAIVGKPE